jgi:hypothetical protein
MPKMVPLRNVIVMATPLLNSTQSVMLVALDDPALPSSHGIWFIKTSLSTPWPIIKDTTANVPTDRCLEVPNNAYTIGGMNDVYKP